MPASSRMVFRCATGALAWMLAPAVAASPRTPTVGVDYAAPPDCPRAAEFLSLVGRRTRGSWQLREGDGDMRFVVEISGDGAVTTGRIRRMSPGPASEPREVAASNCREVVQALALTTALSLDPPGAASSEAAAAQVEAKPAIAPRTDWIVGVQLSALALLPPSPMAGPALLLENRDAAWPDGLALHRPDLRLTLAHTRNDLVAAPDKATFALSTAALAACPLGWSAVRLCGTGEVGVLAGRGIDVDNPRSTRSLWLALGALARARWGLTRALMIEAEAGIRGPLRHTAFVFDMPRLPVAEVPSLVVSGGLAVGLTIP